MKTIKKSNVLIILLAMLTVMLMSAITANAYTTPTKGEYYDHEKAIKVQRGYKITTKTDYKKGQVPTYTSTKKRNQDFFNPRTKTITVSGKKYKFEMELCEDEHWETDTYTSKTSGGITTLTRMQNTLRDAYYFCNYPDYIKGYKIESAKLKTFVADNCLETYSSSVPANQYSFLKQIKTTKKNSLKSEPINVKVSGNKIVAVFECEYHTIGNEETITMGEDREKFVRDLQDDDRFKTFTVTYKKK